jgi:hypothetical protein
MKITPIQADLIDTDIITSSDDADALEADQNSMEFCFECHAPLNAFSINEECPGPDAKKEV